MMVRCSAVVALTGLNKSRTIITSANYEFADVMTITGPDRTYHLFLVRFFFNFSVCPVWWSLSRVVEFVPCGGLSWLHVSFLLHVKYIIAYRIVSFCQSLFFSEEKHN